MRKMGRISLPNYIQFKSFLPILFVVLLLILSACDSGTTPTPASSNKTTTKSNVTAVSSVTAGTTAASTAVSATASTTSAISATASITAGTVTAATTTTTNVTGGTTTAATTPTVRPTLALNSSDQVLRMVSGDINTLDPALANDTDSSFVVRQIFSGLVTLDNNLNVVPDLAAAMPVVTNNGKTYTFKLKHNLTFSDGTSLTAQDVDYSLERATDPKLADPDSADSLPAAEYMSDIVGISDKLNGNADTISGIKVLDDYTIEFDLTAPAPYFLEKMTYNCFFVVSKANVEKGSDWFQNPNASGPFKLDSWNEGQELKLIANDRYANGTPYLHEVDLLMGANAANPFNLYDVSDNRIDVLNLGAGADVERALDKNSPLNKQLVVKPQLELTYLAYNTKLKPFDDPKIRQAFSLVVDRAKIADAMFQDKVVEAKTILPPGMPGYTGNPGDLVYDVSRARDLIAQSSYKSPDNLPKIVLYTMGDAVAGTLQAIYKQTLGIDVEVRQYQYTDFVAGLSQNQFQMFLYGWTADYSDPQDFLQTLLGTGSSYNNSNYSNPKFDSMLQEADKQTDPQKRLQMYGQAEQIALNDAAILPLYHDVSYTLIKPYVKNLVVTGEGILDLKDVYIQKSS